VWCQNCTLFLPPTPTHLLRYVNTPVLFSKVTPSETSFGVESVSDVLYILNSRRLEKTHLSLTEIKKERKKERKNERKKKEKERKKKERTKERNRH